MMCTVGTVCVCVCVCVCELESEFGVGPCDSLLLRPMWLTVCGREGNCWSMPVVTRAFRGADVQQTEAHRAHREAQWAQNWWLIPHTPFTPVCLLRSSTVWARAVTDRELSPNDWAVLKDFTCLDFSTSGLVRSRSTSHVNSLQSCCCKLLFTGLGRRVRHRSKFTNWTLNNGGAVVVGIKC